MFAEHRDARRLSIEAVHEACFVFQVRRDEVEETVSHAALRRLRDDSGGLVDSDHIVVFMEHDERWKWLGPFGDDALATFFEHHHHLLAWTDASAGIFDAPAIQVDGAALDEGEHFIAIEFQGLAQCTVDSAGSGDHEGPALHAIGAYNHRVELSLNTLVEQLDEQFVERATRAFRAAAGIARDVPAVPELPEISRLDAWQVLSELLSSPRVDEAKRARLVLLRRYVARAHLEAATALERDRVENFLHAHTFFAAARTWTPAEVQRDGAKLAAREARVALYADWSSQLETHESHAARKFDRTLEAIAALKLTPTSFVEELHGRPIAERAKAAETMLKETADAHLDLLGYALKKVDPLLTPRVAAEHDAERAANAPWLMESFRREDLQHALTRCLGDLGLSLNADGRLTVDSDARPGRDPRAQCFELKVPDSIRLLLTPDSGVEAWSGWLSTWGIGLHRANVGRTLPFVERRLGDRAVIDAIGVLFESFLLDEGWLKRYLRFSAAQAREAARAFAFRQLHQVRKSAARALYSHEATSRGSTSGLPDDFRPRMANALHVDVPRGETLFAIDAFGDQLLRLDAFSLEHALRSQLLERFNEDFWRNPATGRWLLDLAARGQRDDAVAVAKFYGATGEAPLQILEAAQHRIRVMGA